MRMFPGRGPKLDRESSSRGTRLTVATTLRETGVIPPEQQPDQPFTAFHSIRPPAGTYFAAGAWKVEIRIDDYLMRTLSFTVTE